MPVVFDSGASQRKQKQSSDQAPSAGYTSSREAPGVPSAPQPEHPIVTVEKASQSTLPTAWVSYMAGLGYEKNDLAKAARSIARHVDVPPLYLFGTKDPSKYRSPITGEPISMKEAQRFTQNYAPVAIASMLAQTLAREQEAPTGRVMGRNRKVEAKAPPPTDPKRLSQFASALARSADFNLTTGLGIAYKLASSERFSPKTFEHNLELARTWLEASTGKHASDEAAVSVAVRNSQSGTARSVKDVPMLLYGKEAIRSQERAAAQLLSLPVTQYGTPEQIQTAQAENLYLQQQQAVAQGELPPVTPEGMLGPDYWKQITEIEQKVKLDQEAFQHSWTGRALTGLGHYQNAQYKALYDLGIGLVTPVAAALATIPGTDASPSDVMRFSTRLHQNLWSATENGESPGTLIADHYALPHWSSMAMDFGIQWFTDPLVVATKVPLKALREGSVLPGILRHESTFGRLAEKLPIKRVVATDEEGNFVARLPREGEKAVNILVAKRRADVLRHEWGQFEKAIPAFADSGVSKRLFQAGVVEDDIPKMLTKLDRLRGQYEARSTLEPQFMQKLAQNIKEAGLTGDEAFKAWKEGVVAHFIGVGPDGSVAAKTVADRLLQSRKTWEGSVKVEQITGEGRYAETTSGLLVPENTAQQLAREVYEGGQQTGFPGWLSVEVPGGSRLGEFGPRRAGRAAVQKFTNNAIGQHTNRLISYNPGRELDVTGNPAQYIYLHANRWAEFSETEARTQQAAINDILSSGVNIRQQIANKVKEIDKLGWDRMLANKNIDPFFKDEMFNDFYKSSHAANDTPTTFGRNAEDFPVTYPLVGTQLEPHLFVNDPVAAKQFVNRYISLRSRLAQDLKSAFGGQGKLLEAANVNASLLKGIDLTHDLYKTWLRFWKGATVFRPAYITRVIGIDENLRQFATVSSMTDRIASLHMASDSEKAIRKGLTTAGTPIRAVEDALYQKVITVGDDVVKIERAGARPTQPLYSTMTRQIDLTEEMARKAPIYGRAMSGSAGWDLIQATAKNETFHMQHWVDDLVLQFKGHEAGRVALESVRDGDTIAQTETKLVTWAKQDHFVELSTNIGVAPQDVQMWASDLASTIHGYTMGEKSVASLALDGDRKALTQFLRRTTKLEDRPEIHGPTVENLIKGGPGKWIADSASSAFLRIPEDAFNRQPFGKIWETRAREAMYRGLDHVAAEHPEVLRELTGGKRVLPPQMKVLVDRAATKFARGQVQRIMFDFSRQSRFTEMLQHIFPFPQPFFEGFQAWGHIAWRNPGAIGRGRALFQLGKESGFIEKDPVSGEYGISVGAYRPAAMAYASIFGGNPDLVKHATFFHSFASMNMLTQSTVKFGGDGILGKTIGGVPIPVMGTMPWYQMLLQHVFANSDSALATGFLFQFGPKTNLLPGPVRAVARALWPQNFSDSSQESLALSITEAMHRFGLDKDAKGKQLNTDQIAEIANHDAAEIMGMRGIMGLVTPAALRISFEGQKEDQAAFQGYIDSSDSFTEALKRWTKDHPDKWMIPAGKTFQNGGYSENQKAPRIPASQFVAALFNQVGIGDFMRNNPQWAALMLIGTDPSVADGQDFPTFAKLIGNGNLSYRNPQQYWDAGESNVVWPEIDKFYKQIWTPGLADIEKLGADQQDNAYAALVERRKHEFFIIAQQHPNWAEKHWKPIYDPSDLENQRIIGYDWPTQGTKDTVPVQIIRHDAWNIITTPGMEAVPGFVALREYMEGTKTIQEDMFKHKITDINGDNATGYLNQYSKLVSSVLGQYPDFEPFLRNYFGVRFKKEGTASATETVPGPGHRTETVPLGPGVAATDDLVSDLSQTATERLKIPAERRARADALDTQLEGLFDTARRNPENDAQQAEAYLKATDLTDSLYSQTKASPALTKVLAKEGEPAPTGRQTVEDWWKTQGKSYRDDYKLGLATKPVIFYSTFDFSRAGVKVSKQASGWLRAMAQARVDIEKQFEAHPDTYSKGDGYKAIDAWVRQQLGKDKTFDTVIEHMNSWTWPIRANTNYTKGNSRAAEAWTNILGMFDDLQPQINKIGLQGLSYGTDAEIRTYKAVQDQVTDIVNQYFDWSPAFKEQWNDLHEQLGKPLIHNWFLPDDYFGAIGKAAKP